MPTNSPSPAEPACASSSNDALRARVLERLVVLIDSLATPPSPKGRWSWVNSPFVITVLGGVALGILASQLQARGAVFEREAVRRAELHDVRRAFLGEFASKVGSMLEDAWQARSREMWMWHNDHDNAAARYPDGRTFAETRVQYETLKDRYFANGTADSLCAQVRGTFESARVRELAQQLDTTMDEFMKAENKDDLRANRDRADASAQALFEAMCSELMRGGE